MSHGNRTQGLNLPEIGRYLFSLSMYSCMDTVRVRPQLFHVSVIDKEGQVLFYHSPKHVNLHQRLVWKNFEKNKMVKIPRSNKALQLVKVKALWALQTILLVHQPHLCKRDLLPPLLSSVCPVPLGYSPSTQHQVQNSLLSVQGCSETENLSWCAKIPLMTKDLILFLIVPSTKNCPKAKVQS